MNPEFIPDPSISPTPGFIPNPGQASAALGHSNGLVMNTLKNVATGASKETISTLGNIGTGIEKGLDTAANAIPGVHANTAATSAVTSANPALQPQGLGEKVGATGAAIGQFLAPGDAEAGLAEKAAPIIGKLPDLLGITGKAASGVVGAVKTALKAAVSGLSFGGTTAAQTGNLGQSEESVGLGAATGGLSGALTEFGSGLGEALQKADFKLSPAQEAKASGKVDSAAKFMQSNGLLGSESSKFSKLTQLNSSLEGALQSSLPDTLKVPKSQVMDNINATVEQLKTEDPAIYSQARSSADKAIDLMNSQEGDSVSVKDALNAKRSYGSAAFKQSKFAVRDPNVVSEGSYAVEQGFQKALSDTLDSANANIKVPSTLSKYFNGASSVSLQDFNKVYSDAITSKNLTSLARFKKDSSLFGRFFGLWAGESIGQAISPGLGGKIIGGGIGEMASQKVPSLVRGAAERVIANPNAAENVSKVGQGVANQ